MPGCCRWGGVSATTTAAGSWRLHGVQAVACTTCTVDWCASTSSFLQTAQLGGCTWPRAGQAVDRPWRRRAPAASLPVQAQARQDRQDPEGSCERPGTQHVLRNGRRRRTLTETAWSARPARRTAHDGLAQVSPRSRMAHPPVRAWFVPVPGWQPPTAASLAMNEQACLPPSRPSGHEEEDHAGVACPAAPRSKQRGPGHARALLARRSCRGRGLCWRRISLSMAGERRRGLAQLAPCMHLEGCVAAPLQRLCRTCHAARRRSSRRVANGRAQAQVRRPGPASTRPAHQASKEAQGPEHEQDPARKHTLAAGLAARSSVRVAASPPASCGRGPRSRAYDVERSGAMGRPTARSARRAVRRVASRRSEDGGDRWSPQGRCYENGDAREERVGRGRSLAWHMALLDDRSMLCSLRRGTVLPAGRTVVRQGGPRRGPDTALLGRPPRARLAVPFRATPAGRLDAPRGTTHGEAGRERRDRKNGEKGENGEENTHAHVPTSPELQSGHVGNSRCTPLPAFGARLRPPAVERVPFPFSRSSGGSGGPLGRLVGPSAALFFVALGGLLGGSSAVARGQGSASVL